jgi:hypothetical protein
MAGLSAGKGIGPGVYHVPSLGAARKKVIQKRSTYSQKTNPFRLFLSKPGHCARFCKPAGDEKPETAGLARIRTLKNKKLSGLPQKRVGKIIKKLS